MTPSKSENVLTVQDIESKEESNTGVREGEVAHSPSDSGEKHGGVFDVGVLFPSPMPALIASSDILTQLQL